MSAPATQRETRPGLEAFLHPRSIAVVGASADLDRTGGRPLRLLREYGFPGEVYPVNPRHEEILGLRCYPTVRAIPGPVDVALVCVGRDRVVKALEDCVRKGVKAAVIITAGFAEAGEEGRREQERIGTVVRETGLRVCGPNCMGIVGAQGGLILTYTIALGGGRPLRPGPVGVVTQSGALGATLLVAFQERQVGLSYLITVGNEVDLDMAECLEGLVADAETRLILGYVEGVRDGPRFVRAANAARAAGKPLILLKAGTSPEGRRAAASHTAALAGDAAIYEGLFRQLGIVRARSLEELADLGAVFSAGRRPAGNRVGFVTFSGGAGALAADRCAEAGLQVPPLAPASRERLAKILPPYASTENPVDLVTLFLQGGDATPLRICGEILAADPGIDNVHIILGLYHHMAGPLAEAVVAVARATGKPVSASWISGPEEGLARLRAGGVPAFRDPIPGVDALAALCRHATEASPPGARWPEAAPGREGDEERAGERLRALLGEIPEDSWLPYRAVRALLEAYRIPLAAGDLVGSAADAVEAAGRLGYPVAAKLLSAALPHKSEGGWVCLGLGDPRNLRTTAEELLRRAAEGGVPVDGLLVQRMVRGEVEMILGLRRDEQFGPVVAVGMGGIFAEVLRDVVLAFPPLPPEEIRRLLRRLRGWPLLAGARGRPACDVEAVVAAVSGLARMAQEVGPAILEMDINPVIVGSAGALSVDARVRVAGRAAEGGTGGRGVDPGGGDSRGEDTEEVTACD